MAIYPEVPGFDVRRVIGRGGTATVYEAWDETFGRLVAIKVLEGVDLSNAELAAFRQEIRAMGNLEDEPHVVPVYQSGATVQGAPYIVMKYVSGGSLATQIGERGPLPPELVLRIGVEVGGALHSAHRRGIRHCDIKPANVLFDDSHGAMLSDFGVAAVALGPLTQRQGMTVAYAAPEVLHDEVPTAASDIYSFGATLHALLTGSAPFGAGSSGAVINKILSTPAPALPDHLPRELRELVAAMMQKHPDDRPQSAAGVAASFQEILDGLDRSTLSPPASSQEHLSPTSTRGNSTTSTNISGSRHVANATTRSRVQSGTAAQSPSGLSASRRRAAQPVVLLLLLVLPALAIWQWTSRGDDSTQTVVVDEVAGVSVTPSSQASTQGAVDEPTEQTTSTLTPTQTPVAAAASGSQVPPEIAVVDPELGVPTSLAESHQDVDTNGSPFISLRWSKPPGAAFVEIERDGVTITIDDNLAYRDTPTLTLTGGQEVTYRIRSVNQAQTAASEWSEPLTITVEEHELGVPTSLAVSGQDVDAAGRPFISLRWSKPPGAAFVEIERDGVTITIDDNLAYRDTPDPTLIPGQEVTYRIRSLDTNQANPSDWSQPLTVTVGT